MSENGTDSWRSIMGGNTVSGNAGGSTSRIFKAVIEEGCKHINLAANVCGYTPVNLGKLIKEGILSDIETIHRRTIDRATARKEAGMSFI